MGGRRHVYLHPDGHTVPAARTRDVQLQVNVLLPLYPCKHGMVLNPEVWRRV